jgi:hypothetical protein
MLQRTGGWLDNGSTPKMVAYQHMINKDTVPLLNASIGSD